VQEMVSAISQLMDDPGLRRRMAESSPGRVRDKYNLQKNVLRLSEVFSRWTALQHGSSSAL
jgi:glycosyltransferase involved in cell wall biosynthesis